jgi:hypothetical protein
VNIKIIDRRAVAGRGRGRLGRGWICHGFCHSETTVVDAVGGYGGCDSGSLVNIV